MSAIEEELEDMPLDALYHEIRAAMPDGFPLEEIDEVQRRITIGEVSRIELPSDILKVVDNPPEDPMGGVPLP